MSNIYIVENKCNLCGVCRDVCPCDAIILEKSKIRIKNENCTLCGLCINACTDKAIVRQGEDGRGPERLKQYSGICVYIEHYEGKLYPSVLEAIWVAGKLKKQTGSKVFAVIVGSGIRNLAYEVFSFGVDEVWMVDRLNIHNYAEDIYAGVISEIIFEMRPEIFLATGTKHGRSLFPRIAARLKTGLCADCIQLHFNQENKNLVATRPAYSGRIMARIEIPNHRPQMATIKQGIFEHAQKIEGHQGKVVDKSTDFQIKDSVFKIIEVAKDKYDLANLEQAEIIVAVGRGIKKAENLPLIYSFAKALGGSVGASRSVVDAGWIDHSHQIGQTGKIVRPRIYFACGISGAIQHLVGMKDSRIVVAINSDREAPILKIANYAVVGDLFDIIPEFIKQVT